MNLGGGFSTSLSYSADLLGRDGGGQLGWGLGYRWAPWPQASASVGDAVSLELSAYDLSKGRITFRHIERRGPGPDQQRSAR